MSGIYETASRERVLAVGVFRGMADPKRPHLCTPVGRIRADRETLRQGSDDPGEPDVTRRR
jgi:hypothetical protein